MLFGIAVVSMSIYLLICSFVELKSAFGIRQLFRRLWIGYILQQKWLKSE